MIEGVYRCLPPCLPQEPVSRPMGIQRCSVECVPRRGVFAAHTRNRGNVDPLASARLGLKSARELTMFVRLTLCPISALALPAASSPSLFLPGRCYRSGHRRTFGLYRWWLLESSGEVLGFEFRARWDRISFLVKSRFETYKCHNSTAEVWI